MSTLHVMVVTGLSGAGRSTAIRVLEDLGFYCVDNLPPALAPALLEHVSKDPSIQHVGLGIDVRSRAFLEGAGDVLDSLSDAGHDVEVIFLDCADDVLVRRFSETRRPHALAPEGDVLSGIAKERERTDGLRARAAQTIDTTGMNVHDLKRALVDYVAQAGRTGGMVTRIVSFGFKYGMPIDADLVFDVRYLPNPHFVPELKPRSGLDPEVSSYVLEREESKELLADLTGFLRRTLPRYQREGKAYLTVAIGCTGGKHRSVAIAEALGAALDDAGELVISHRDSGRWKT